MKNYTVGIDIGGTTIKLGIFSVNGELIKRWEITTRKEENGKYILSDITKSIDEALKEQNIEKSDVEGIGVGVPGPVKADGTVVKCVNLGWDTFNVEEALEKETGLKVKAANDANIAALGEAWQGGGKGYNSMIMVTLGTGVGGGVIIDGKIVAGANGAGGEIGHINVCKDETELCGCGKTGCLEQYTSATGIANSATKRLANTDVQSSLREVEDITAKDVFDAAKNNDEFAVELINEFAETLGSALAQIACVCDPEVFVIGGGVSKAGTIITDYVGKSYKKNAFIASMDTKFEIASLGNDAGIYGGAKLTLNIK